jgi:hypothetical protein
MSDNLGFCRDCFADVPPRSGGRCAICGSPRLLGHTELPRLTIAHVDCDAFYAAVEKRDNPALRDKPLIIGGGKRGVVSTCCYVARTYGVRSAMPMFKALAACPDAVVLSPDITARGAAVDRRGFSRSVRDRGLAFDDSRVDSRPLRPPRRNRNWHYGFDRPQLL